MPTITNFNVDSIASGITAPRGPLVRVTDMATLPTPNQDATIEFTSTPLSVSVYMSFEQLSRSATRNRIIDQAGGISQRAQAVKEAVANIYAVTNALSSPHTYEDYLNMVEAFRANMDVLRGYY